MSGRWLRSPASGRNPVRAGSPAGTHWRSDLPGEPPEGQEINTGIRSGRCCGQTNFSLDRGPDGPGHGVIGTGYDLIFVAEIFDAQETVLAERAYGGRSETVASEAVGTQILFQALRHPGVSLLIKELFSHDRGNALYVKEFHQLAGHTFHEAASLFSRAAALGLLR